MVTKIPLIFIILPAILLSSCFSNHPSAESTETFVNSEIIFTPATEELQNPTSDQPTGEPHQLVLSTTATIDSSLTPPPIDSVVESSPTPTYKYRRSPTPTPTLIRSDAIIQILSPGSLSMVVSPLIINAYAQPGADQSVYIELIDQNGRLIAGKNLVYSDLPRQWAPVNLELPYDISNEVEFSRLQIRTMDNRQRTTFLNSTHLFLQRTGVNKIYPNRITTDRLLLRSPEKFFKATKGSFPIDLEFLPINNNPLIVELLTESGSIVSTKEIQVPISPEISYLHINLDMPYQVADRTLVLLTFRQQDDQLPGDVYVFSQLIYLNP